MSDICGVVLAGGGSTRMGTDKAQLPCGDGTFLEALAFSMDGIFAERMVAGRTAPPEWKIPGVHFQSDIRPGFGPLGGIYTALLLCQSPWALFVSCDTPLLDREIYERVCGKRNPEGREIVVAKVPGGGWGNFPLLIPKTYVRTVRRLLDLGERSVRSLLEASVIIPAPMEEAHAERIRSINTPGEYETFLRRRHALVA